MSDIHKDDQYVRLNIKKEGKSEASKRKRALVLIAKRTNDLIVALKV